MSNNIRTNIIKDELPLNSWLLVGASIQSVAFIVLPKFVALGLCLLLLSIHVVLFSLTSVGLRRNARQDGMRTGIFSARVPKTLEVGGKSREGTNERLTVQAQNKGDKEDQMVIFLLGSRPTDVRGRLSAEFKELTSLFMETMVEAAQPENRARYGFLGQCAPLVSTELDQTNVAINISYWRSREGLMAFARESASHRKAWAWFADGMVAENEGGSMKRTTVGIMHELYYCSERQASRTYANFKDWGFIQTKFPTINSVTGEETLIGPKITEKAIRGPPQFKEASSN